MGEVLSRRSIHAGRIVRLFLERVLLPNGAQTDLEVIEEETGYRAGRLEPLGWIWTTPGFTTEKIFLFAAHDLTAGRAGLDADEVISPERMTFRDAIERAARGEITDAKTIAILFRASRVARQR